MERKSDHATTNRIYDEFEPISNWKTEQGFETLTVYLPGFTKEQLKVQVTTTRKLRVMGDRPTGANKWIRFRKEIPIPPYLDVDSVSARFEGANLVVRLSRSEPMAKQSLPSDTTAKPSPVPKETLKLPNPIAKETERVQPLKQVEKVQSPKQSREEEAEQPKKEEALKVNEYKENLGGYVALMKNNKKVVTAGVVAPAAAVLLLSLGFYAGRMFTCY